MCVLMGTYGDRPDHNQDAEAQWHLWFLPLGRAGLHAHGIAQLHACIHTEHIWHPFLCSPPLDKHTQSAHILYPEVVG